MAALAWAKRTTLIELADWQRAQARLPASRREVLQ
jgi:hypothetical protein